MLNFLHIWFIESKKMKRLNHSLRFFSCCLSLIFSHSAVAQNHEVFLSRNYDYKFQSYLNKQDVSFHSSIKPLNNYDIKKRKVEYEFGVPFKGFNSKEVEGHKSKVQVRFFPLIEISGTAVSDVVDTFAYNMGIGAAAVVQAGEKFNARVEFTGSKFQYPDYLKREVESTSVGANGQLWHQESNGYHSTNLNGFLDYRPGEVFDFRIGHGRNFIGEGYRSMMLSDNAGNYSYGRITADIWRLKYMVLYAHLKDQGTNKGHKYQDFDNKFTTVHYLSWNINKWFNLGFFESVVWPGRDTLLDRGYDPNYLNPVIFMRPVEYSTGSSDNSLLGIALNFKPKNGWTIYSQLVLDEFLLSELQADVKDLVKPDPARISGWWANKYAFQLGVKAHNIFGVSGLGVQSEFNLVRPFTYSHGNSVQNFGHLNRSLAHPLGSNFYESISFISYQFGNSLLEVKTQFFQQGHSTDSTNFGEDIFQTYRSRSREYGHYTGQGIARTISAFGVGYNYIIVPESNLRLFADFTIRNQNWITKRTDIFLSVGIRSSITNRYSDI